VRIIEVTGKSDANFVYNKYSAFRVYGHNWQFGIAVGKSCSDQSN
jgi:hypothetical protein